MQLGWWGEIKLLWKFLNIYSQFLNFYRVVTIFLQIGLQTQLEGTRVMWWRKYGLKSCEFGDQARSHASWSFGKQRTFSICKEKNREEVKFHGVHLKTEKQPLHSWPSPCNSWERLLSMKLYGWHNLPCGVLFYATKGSLIKI